MYSQTDRTLAVHSATGSNALFSEWLETGHLEAAIFLRGPAVDFQLCTRLLRTNRTALVSNLV
jgi:hypothetical protein